MSFELLRKNKVRCGFYNFKTWKALKNSFLQSILQKILQLSLDTKNSNSCSNDSTGAVDRDRLDTITNKFQGTSIFLYCSIIL